MHGQWEEGDVAAEWSDWTHWSVVVVCLVVWCTCGTVVVIRALLHRFIPTCRTGFPVVRWRVG
jgi:hypothetical protein